MNNSIARAISFLFNPLFIMLLAPSLIVYKTDKNIHEVIKWTSYSFVFLLALAGFLYYGVRKGFFTDMDISKRSQRPILFIASFILAAAYLTGLYLFHAPPILLIITYSIIIGLIFVSIINMKIKASLHVAAISALLFAVAIEYSGYYLLLLIFIPLIAWSRVKIKRHTVRETVIGGIIGSLLSLFIYGLIQYFRV